MHFLYVLLRGFVLSNILYHNKPRIASILREVRFTGAHVLILNSGGGVLALLAARDGAGRVTCIERSQTMYRIAIETIQKSRYSGLLTRLFHILIVVGIQVVSPVTTKAMLNYRLVCIGCENPSYN